MLPLLLTITLLTSPVFDVYQVPDSYIQSAYQIADQKLELMDDEDIIEEEIVEEQIDDEIFSEEIPEDPEEDTEDYSVMALEDESSIIAELQKNNEYWDLFLDSYPVEVHKSVYFTNVLHGFYVNFNTSSSSFQPLGGLPNACYSYIPVVHGITYNFPFLNLDTNYNNLQLVFANTFDPDSGRGFGVQLFKYDTAPPVLLSYTPSSDGFLIFSCINKNISELIQRSYVEFDVIEQESYTLSELGNAVMSLNQRVEDMTKYNNYELYSDAASLEASDMYINKYEFETFKLLRYLVVLVACNIGAIFILLFSLRCRNGTS